MIVDCLAARREVSQVKLCVLKKAPKVQICPLLVGCFVAEFIGTGKNGLFQGTLRKFSK